jgi:hypothetical protein
MKQTAEQRIRTAMSERPPVTERPITILGGHPVPYSITVQIDGRSVNDAADYLDQVDTWLAERGMRRTRVEGAYVWYELAG